MEYGPRTVNQLMGRALSPFSDEVVIGNKDGAWRRPAGEWLTDSRPKTVRTRVEDALLDMRTEPARSPTCASGATSSPIIVGGNKEKSTR